MFRTTEEEGIKAMACQRKYNKMTINTIPYEMFLSVTKKCTLS